MSTKYDSPSIGCYLDHANYNNDELSQGICALAQSFGWQPDADTLALLELDTDSLTDEQSEALYDASQEAEDWLNDQESRPCLYWANDGEAGAFGLWPNLEMAREDCEFVSSRNQEYPPADYLGEWLHVNDHGNATLYARTGPDQDNEIWSVV